MMDWINTCLVLLLCVTTITQCMHDCAHEGVTDCQEVDTSECHTALSGPQGQPYGYQLHANMAASFINLTVMVNNLIPKTHRRTLRMVLTNWLGPKHIKLKEMLILMTPSKDTDQWSTCLKIKLKRDMEDEQEKSFSTLIPTHQNISSYQMTVVSTFCDDNGQTAVGHTQYFIKMSELTSNRDWILPVIAYTQSHDKAIVSVTPPSIRIHRNMLTCSTWLIKCGPQPDQLLVAREGNEPDEADESDMQEADEWGMGTCMYYEEEFLLKSSMKNPILNMKVPKGKYQIWIDCVLQNQFSSWPSTAKTIRTPTFTHQGNEDFFIKIQWTDTDKKEQLADKIQQYTHRSEPQHIVKSDSVVPHSNDPLDENDSENNFILVICLTSVFLIFVAIGALVFCKARTNQKVSRIFRENSSDEDSKTIALVPRPPDSNASSSSDTCETSAGESSLDQDNELVSRPNNFCYIPNCTPPLHRFKQTSMDIMTSCSTDLNGHFVGNNESDGFDRDEDHENDDVNVDIFPFQLSKRCSLSKPVFHYNDNSTVQHEINVESFSNTQSNKQEDTGYFSSMGDHSNNNDNSSTIDNQSYNHGLFPITQPMILTLDVRTDSVHFNDMLRGLNSDVSDWRFTEQTDCKQFDIHSIKDDCVSVGEPVLW